ncbi:hypothetical protein SAMN05216413_0813 [Ruminococcaceae bacterium KH2T8]|nr:hypothetical protein SAMN05216413_0813 [Ruminococcaceae bacterium KH2T8]
MASAREILSDILSSEKTSSVDIPVSFDDISVWGASSSDGYLDALEKEFSERATVIPQYRNIKEKIGGALFGFYINHSVNQQNAINARFLEVLQEFRSNNEEILRLTERIKELEMQLGEDGGIR